MNWPSESNDRKADRILEQMQCREGLRTSGFANAVVSDFDSALLSSKTNSIRNIPIALPPKIGKYPIEKCLGHGGFGTVYLGHDPITKRPVAIKLLHENRRKSLVSFLREWTLASELHHPALVKGHELGEFEARPYFAMEYIEGESLDRMIERSRLGESTRPKLADVLTIARNAAEGLAVLHRNGVIHRDIKPSNILVDVQGGAHLTDFGLASLEDGLEADAFVGTLQYSSPEVVAGKPPTIQSDIFSLGSTLYEALTLRRAFAGQDRETVAKAIRESRPLSFDEIGLELPRKLEKIIFKCLEKDPARRYASAERFVLDLQAIAKQPKVPRYHFVFFGLFGLALTTFALATPEQKQEIPVVVSNTIPNTLVITEPIPTTAIQDNRPVPVFLLPPSPAQEIPEQEPTEELSIEFSSTKETTRSLPPNPALPTNPPSPSGRISFQAKPLGPCYHRDDFVFPLMDVEMEGKVGSIFFPNYVGSKSGPDRALFQSIIRNDSLPPWVRLTSDEQLTRNWISRGVGRGYLGLDQVSLFALDANFPKPETWERKFATAYLRGLDINLVVDTRIHVDQIARLQTLAKAIQERPGKTFLFHPWQLLGSPKTGGHPGISAAIALLVQDARSQCHVLSDETNPEWASWPTRLGKALEQDFQVDSKKRVLSRRFQFGTVSLNLAAATLATSIKSAVTIEWR